jgi:hypothetical protein
MKHLLLVVLLAGCTATVNNPQSYRFIGVASQGDISTPISGSLVVQVQEWNPPPTPDFVEAPPVDPNVQQVLVRYTLKAKDKRGLEFAGTWMEIGEVGKTPPYAYKTTHPGQSMTITAGTRDKTGIPKTVMLGGSVGLFYISGTGRAGR